MSTVARAFLEKNGINLQDYQVILQETRDINILLDRYAVNRKTCDSFVCIRDVVGYDFSWRGESDDLFRSFCNYFDSNGDSYHSRANGMLEYPASQMPKKLAQSFVTEPIHLVKVENDKYVVGENGTHRFHILKVSYLGEIAKCQSQEEIDAVNNNFTIPVRVREIDVFKSYCNYILNRFSKPDFRRIWLSCDRTDSNVCNVEHGGTTTKLSNEELLFFVKSNAQEDISSNMEIQLYSRMYPSFAEFINLYNGNDNERKKL